MDYGIKGRVAFVGGGSKGIGFEAARMLAAEGAGIAVVARTRKHIDLAVAAIREEGGEAGYVNRHYIAVDGGHHRSAF